ncbi:MAG: hypothetical protein ACI8PZ_001501 [Myxococcota bacterium]
MWGLIVGAALAHPFGATAAAHRLDATIQPDGLVATWSVDVPTAMVLAGAPTPELGFRRMQAEVVSGFWVRGDGAALDLVKEAGEPTRSDDGSWLFPVQLSASWDSPPRSLVFEDGNSVELRGFYRADVAVTPALAVTASSLVPVDADGAPVVDHSGRWREGDEHRVVRVELQPVWRFGAGGEPRPLRDAMAQPRHPWRWGVGVGLMLLLAAAARRLSRRKAPTARAR